ncbi:MAG: 16S rRNA (cytosine(1402)-N(4))-methyltransferase RsmH [Bryobacterales bacterium]|nr:16S rRNA (cytosine(1402)-N(4))-methyltransferase RsmH [Bryobacterales bacterium]
MHYPVMLPEVLEYLAIRPGGIYLDATAGMGGHSGAIAARLDGGLVIANDRDAVSLAMARANCAEYADRMRFRQGDFSTLPEALREAGVEAVDGLVADFGVSRYQLTSAERGFSLQADGPLDMRMDQSKGITAAEIVNATPEKELADLIYELGEERHSRRIAKSIVRNRPIRSTMELSRAVEQVLPRRGRIAPATQTFLALRRAVNEEDGQLRAFFDVAPGLLKRGGRLVVISFMSLEDRIAKNRLKDLAREGMAKVLTKHVVKPGAEEIAANPASRSAVLRAMERI